MARSKRRLFVKTTFAERVDLDGKTVIVTGASPRSLGFETARTLAEWGAKVVITTRRNTEATLSALSSAIGHGEGAERLKGHPLDLCDADSVVRFVQWYLDAEGDVLDVLVNNAGVHLDLMSEWKEPHLTDDGFEIHWRTNYLGTMHLTHLLLPALEKAAERSGEARIVNVSSKLHFKGSNSRLFEKVAPYNSWKAYGGTKLALVHATFEAERRFADQLGIHSYCLHPGAVSTNVAEKGLEGTLAGRIRNALLSVEGVFLKSPEEGAQTQIHCATAPNLPGGIYYEECLPAEVSEESSDTAVANRLWNETAAWVSSLR
jgi:NAD(P)-dependent dehydrogenase (short-subunit alcohol dehydrogenase family)